MLTLNELIDLFTFYGLIILGVYIFISMFVFNGLYMLKNWLKKLLKAPELSFAVFFNIFFAYPFIFFGLLNEFPLRFEKANKVGWSMILETLKQLHVDKHDQRRDIENVFFIGWRHIFGFYFPCLLLWISMWYNLIIYFFFN